MPAHRPETQEPPGGPPCRRGFGFVEHPSGCLTPPHTPPAPTQNIKKGGPAKTGPPKRNAAATYSPTPTMKAVPSAQRGLTTGFGKRPGVTLPLSPPHTTPPHHPTRGGTGKNHEQYARTPSICDGQALGPLVPVSSTPHNASTPGLSTQSSPGSLTPTTGQETSSRSKLPT